MKLNYLQAGFLQYQARRASLKLSILSRVRCTNLTQSIYAGPLETLPMTQRQPKKTELC